ncbi:hypothetical protein K5X82_14000 [Halosquirtibacter xylanolyticus]|uniref:WD40/YVTN/BNR-like repeat-containing protein n=1 Tax=Halosquirtibacter xylanolyticus TaxID=3374599 RepID=UPI00374A5352|nr:hypothetical protein K5X82_14000 [Prolixibacteraceae bacterium]
MIICYSVFLILSTSCANTPNLEGYNLNNLIIESILLDEDFIQIDFADNDYGAGITDDGLYITEDGGLSWIKRLDSAELKQVKCFNDRKLLVYAYPEAPKRSGYVYTSNDGETFRIIKQAFETLSTFIDIKLFNHGVGFLQTKEGISYHTDDAGVHWKKIDYLQGVSIISMVSRLNGELLVGSPSKGVILLSMDRGVNWKHINTPFKEAHLITYATDGYDILFEETQSHQVMSTTDFTEFEVFDDMSKIKVKHIATKSDGTYAVFGVFYLPYHITPFGRLTFSRDRGDSWTDANGHFFDVGHNHGIIDAEDNIIISHIISANQLYRITY